MCQKEIERSRLSSSSQKRFRKQRSQGLTPYQQATELFGIPGMSAEKLNVLLPLLERQNSNREAQNLAGNARR